MVLNGPLADPEISSNIFARVTGQNHLHDLALPSSEADEVIGRILAPFRELPGIGLNRTAMFAWIVARSIFGLRWHSIAG